MRKEKNDCIFSDSMGNCLNMAGRFEHEPLQECDCKKNQSQCIAYEKYEKKICR
jgi:hypothetical protein